MTIAEGAERLLKPRAGSACSIGGYCCTAQPCSLPAVFLFEGRLREQNAG